MASWAKPGVKVVCVNADFHGYWVTEPDKKLLVGSVYTVKSVEVCDGEVAIHLREINREKSTRHGRALPYRLSRFRPLVTKTQEEDVAMFKRIADDVPLHEMIEAGLYPIN